MSISCLNKPAMPITQLVDLIAQRLYPLYSDQTVALNQAWHLLSSITGKNKAELLVASPPLSFAESSQLDVLLHKIIVEHMPLSYAHGSVPFLGTTIAVHPPLLIPRTETESWCVQVLETIAPYVRKATPALPFVILDLCTGSGCIGVSMAHHLREQAVHIVGIDISSVAIECARLNAAHANLHNCTFLESDLYQALGEGFKCDLILANPPYVSSEEFDTLDPEVRLWEDRNALVADDQGYSLIKRIAAEAPKFLRDDYGCAQLWCEIGSTQAAQTVTYFEQAGFKNIRIRKDLEGHDRVVQAKGAE